MSIKDKPMLIFNTCATCGACKNIRGYDGRPNGDQPNWSPTFIRDLLLTPNGQMRALRIINIHDSELYPLIDHIIEFTLYHMISPSINITPTFFQELMIDPEKFVGTSILRVKLQRENDGTTGFYVEIDGESRDDKCQEIAKQVEKFFLWDFIPSEFSRLRDLFMGNSKEIIDDILPYLEDDPFCEILYKEYNKYVTDPNYYDRQMKVRYGFSWFVSFFYPERLREVEAFYPSWLIVSPSEWSKGIREQEAIREALINHKEPQKLSPIFAKAIGCETKMDGSRFRSYKCKNETIGDCLTQYYGGRLFLNYEESLLNSQGGNTVDIKKYTNTETGVTYTIVGGDDNQKSKQNPGVTMAKLTAIKNHQRALNRNTNSLGAFPPARSLN